MILSIEIPTGRFQVSGPPPFKVAYPFGLPGDGFRRHAMEWKATCVAYHSGVEAAALAGIRNGNEYRYGISDPPHVEMVADMRANGYRGGNCGRLIIHVSKDDAWFAEGNHRIRAAIEAGVAVEVEVRYLQNADEEFLLIPFDLEDERIRVISD